MSKVYDDLENLADKIFIKKNNNKEFQYSISKIDTSGGLIQNTDTPRIYINVNYEDYQTNNIGKDNNNSQLNPNENSSKYFNFNEIENNKNKIKEINIKIEKIFDLEENNEYYKKFNDNKSKLK
jgi:hypothetical protein